MWPKKEGEEIQRYLRGMRALLSACRRKRLNRKRLTEKPWLSRGVSANSEWLSCSVKIATVCDIEPTNLQGGLKRSTTAHTGQKREEGDQSNTHRSNAILIRYFKSARIHMKHVYGRWFLNMC